MPGGARLADLVPLMVSRLQERGRAAFDVLAEVVAPAAAYYDVVFVDCPPESTILTDLALTAARWVVMPTKSDVGGLVGMRLVAERFAMARERNRSWGCSAGGQVLFGTGSRSRRVHAEVRGAVDRAFGGHSPLFATAIRHAERSARTRDGWASSPSSSWRSPRSPPGGPRCATGPRRTAAVGHRRRGRGGLPRSGRGAADAAARGRRVRHRPEVEAM